MARKSIQLTLEGKSYKLRLTMRAMRALRTQFDEEPMTVIMSAVSDIDRLCAVLTEALSWDGSGNDVTDGEAFYDLLVDGGYGGQAKQAELMLDLAVYAGLVAADQAKKLKAKLLREINGAYDRLDEAPPPAVNSGENPTTDA
ncbi:MAG: hypothetical protein LIO42_02295 [Oscillospiraceae bacterium]|nr:hypothetical protein [Oscillospiraceae bacterium]